MTSGASIPPYSKLRAARRQSSAQEAQPRWRVGNPGSPGAASSPEAWETQLAERTADLQRLKSEYDHYRKRVRRDRLAVREIAVANVLGRLLSVLDAIDRAREHGELDPGFRAVADAPEMFCTRPSGRCTGHVLRELSPRTRARLSQQRPQRLAGDAPRPLRTARAGCARWSGAKGRRAVRAGDEARR